MFKNWTYTEKDKEYVNNLKDFIPDKIFDIHTHLYRVDNLNLSGVNMLTEGPEIVTLELWHEHLGRQVGKVSLKGGLFIPLPTENCSIKDSNDFLVEQIRSSPASKGLLLVSPQTIPESIDEYFINKQIIGFKPYHLFSNPKPTNQASIESYLPEWLWKKADDMDLVITLHLVKDKALSDTDNQSYIIEKCRKYPNAKLILAHAGRGFHAQNTVKGVAGLRGIENIWFDTAGICESAALKSILMEFGPSKLLWGSDFPVSEIRGRCVSIGDSFLWLGHDTLKTENINYKLDPLLVGIESLLALRDVCNDFGLNSEDIKKIFYENALKLTGIKIEADNITQALYKHAKKIIPGRTQLFSKRPEIMAPGQWPAYYREARGCETWDLDGRHYYDMSTNSVGACLLGFKDPDVDKAVIRRINLGSISTLNSPEEVDLADKLCEIHPWAEQVRFARTGGETAAVAIRIARATTDRSMIAICGYHGWHDWYLAANLGENDALRGHLLPGLNPLGVPRELRGTAVAFNYNKKIEFREIIEKYKNKLAAVIMEPCRHNDPEPGFLEYIRKETHKHGVLFIIDEISLGWRLQFGGAHLKFGVIPDIAIFAKALGNGYPIGAVIGTKEAMEGANSSFISSTYWTEGIGPTAALAVLKKMSSEDVPKHVAYIGSKVMEYWKSASVKYNLPVEVEDGYPCLANFKFNHELSEELKTLYTQLMLERGFLAGMIIYPTLAHNDKIVDLYGEAIDEVFSEITEALSAGIVKDKLRGPVADSGFKRLT